MNTYSLETLEQEVSNTSVETQDDLMVFLGLAARLASLGRPEQFERWPTLAQGRFDVVDTIQQRANVGMWELEHFSGEALGQVIVEAQDMACLQQVDLSKTRLLADAYPFIDSWVDTAEHTPLDDDSSDFLRDFLNRFPITDEHQLVKVSHPMGMGESVLLDMMTHVKESIVMTTTSSSHSKEQERAELQIMADGKPPTGWMKRFSQEHNGNCILPNRDQIRANAALEKDWRVTLEVHSPKNWKNSVRSARLGSVPGSILDNEDGYWSCEFKLGSFPVELQSQLAVSAKFFIKLDCGNRLIL